MRIYVDFDDVIAETAMYFTGLVRKMFGKNIAYEDIVFFDLQKSFSLCEEDYSKMMEKAHQPEELISYKETPGASETIRKWISEGHEVNIVTGRPYSSSAATRKWLENYGLGEVKVIHVDKYGREKADLKSMDRSLTVGEFSCLRYDFAVEDSPAALKHLEKMKECTVAVFDRPWNKGENLDEKKFFRCKSWKDVDSLLKR